MKCLREYYQKLDRGEFDADQAFLSVEKVLHELYEILHFSIFYNECELGHLTSLLNSRDGVYGAGDRLIILNEIWSDRVLINGQIFSTSNKLEIYDSFVKGFDFLALGAESLISIPVKHQGRVLGVINVTLPRNRVLKEDVLRMSDILSTMKPYIFDARKKFVRLMPGVRMKLASL